MAQRSSKFSLTRGDLAWEVLYRDVGDNRDLRLVPVRGLERFNRLRPAPGEVDLIVGRHPVTADVVRVWLHDDEPLGVRREFGLGLPIPSSQVLAEAPAPVVVDLSFGSDNEQHEVAAALLEQGRSYKGRKHHLVRLGEAVGHYDVAVLYHVRGVEILRDLHSFHVLVHNIAHILLVSYLIKLLVIASLGPLMILFKRVESRV